MVGQALEDDLVEESDVAEDESVDEARLAWLVEVVGCDALATARELVDEHRGEGWPF